MTSNVYISHCLPGRADHSLSNNQCVEDNLNEAHDTWRASTAMVKMEWERLEAPLSAVRAFCRALLPRRRASSASSALATATCSIKG